MVVTRITAGCIRPSSSEVSPSPLAPRISASEFPVTPSTCHGTPSGSSCVSAFLHMSQAEECPSDRQCRQSFVICTPTMDKRPSQTISKRITNSDVSFEVKEVKNVKEVVPQWDDDDVDELMIMSPKRKPHISPIDIADEPEAKACEVASEDAAIMEVSKEESQRISAEDFEVIRRISHPGSRDLGELVYGRRQNTSQFYSIKVFRKCFLSTETQGYLRARTEQMALRLVSERGIPFAPKLRWSFQDEKALYLIMEDYIGQSLRTCVECEGILPFNDAKIYAAELVIGISALHAAGIVHRNLRPENLLIGKEGKIVLTDYGYAKLSQGKIKNSAVLVELEPYQAPELLLGWVHDCAVDWWSFGLLLCYMLTGKHAIMAEDDISEVHPSIWQSRILHGKLAAGISGSLSVDALDLISKCLERNPVLRIKAHHVKGHAFFAGFDWERWDLTAADSPSPGYIEQQACRTGDGEASSTDEINELLHTAASRCSGSEAVAIDGFSFSWDLAATDSIPAQISGNVNRVDQTSPLSSICSLSAASGCLTQDTCDSEAAKENFDTYARIPAEFGGCPNMPASRKFGTLRKYSSLNFDLDTLECATPSGRMNPMGASPLSPARQLRKSQSIYASPFTQTSTSTRNKLRKKTRPDSTPIPAYMDGPILDLPPGIEQIGSGIGYTRRVTPVHARLSMSTLTPRSCHGLFSGGRLPGMTPRYGRKKTGSGAGVEHAGGVAVVERVDDSEDQMDAVMREMYGSRWNLGLSASDLSHAGGAEPRVYAALMRTSVGLGLSENALEMTRGGGLPTPPAELSTLSPDSTLRLVSPSTHMHGVEYC